MIMQLTKSFFVCVLKNVNGLKMLRLLFYQPVSFCMCVYIHVYGTNIDLTSLLREAKWWIKITSKEKKKTNELMLFLFPLGSGYKWRIFKKPHLPFLTVSVSIITFHFLASLQLGQNPVTNVRLWTGMSFLVLNFQEHGCQLPVLYFCSDLRPYSSRWSTTGSRAAYLC